jgi:hypothetical protein
LAQNMDYMCNIRSRNSEINKADHNVSITRRILKKYAICRTKLQVKVHRCCCRSMISNSGASNQILYVFGLYNIISLWRVQHFES